MSMKDLRFKTIEHPDKVGSYWKAEWRVVSIIVVTGLLYNALLAAGPVLQGMIIDLIVAHGARSLILTRIAEFVLLIAFVQFNRYLKRYYVRNFANRTSATMRMIVYDDIMGRDMEELKGETAGDLMTRAISDVGECVEGMRKFTTEVFDTGVLMVSYFVVLVHYDLKLTLIASIFIPASMVLAGRMKTVIYRYTRAYREQLSRVSEKTLENVENAVLYRTAGVEKIKSEKYDEELEELKKRGIPAAMLETAMQPVYKVIGLIGIVLVVYYGGMKTVEGTWTIGVFTAYIAIFASFALKCSKAAKLFNSVQKAQVSWRRIFPYLSHYAGRSPVKAETLVEDASPAADLKVRDLSFGVVSGVSFEGKVGQVIGVTGPVASGKSSIGSALQGLWPYGGSITINGRELGSMSQKEISRFVTYMGHDAQLLSDTIYRNLTMGEDGDVTAVLDDVCFGPDLETMEDGLDTMVGASGIRLSGGQQSRLALARALFNKGRILVLDDPFAAVDADTEKNITRNLRRRYADSLIILISHRVSAFDETDRVLLVSGGTAEFSTHNELMRDSEVYRQIFTSQREGEDA